MIQILNFVLIFILLVVSAHAQGTPSSKCELQQLAIEAALGNADAQYNLGVEFFRGANVPKDYGKAASMWLMASKGGNIEAANNLGFLKYYGRPGVERDYAEGIRLWRVAAEKGFAESQVHMSQAYSDGRFLKQDFIEAYAWAIVGKHYSSKMSERIDNPEIGNVVQKDAEKVLAQVRERLSSTQLAEAEKRAAAYIVKYAPR